MERNYQDLRFQYDKVDTFLDQFFSKHRPFTLRGCDKTPNKTTIKFGCLNQDDATVVLYLKKGGTTTIQYKTGKNQKLGQILANFLYDTVDPNETLTVNLTLKGIDQDIVSNILSDLEDVKDSSGSPEFSITKHAATPYANKITVSSKNYNDQLKIHHYHTTNKLQIQGKPLFAYRNLSYSLAILLDQDSLLSVISRTSDEDRLLVRQEVAEVHIKNIYPISFERLCESYQGILVSSYCVKLASPDLPEYSMLIFADLRVLEGVIKDALLLFNMPTSSATPERLDIGHYFYCTGKSSTLKTSYHQNINCTKTRTAIEACYQFYREQRHALFHAEDMPIATRTITSLREVMDLSSDIADLIEELYKSCKDL